MLQYVHVLFCGKTERSLRKKYRTVFLDNSNILTKTLYTYINLANSVILFLVSRCKYTT